MSIQCAGDVRRAHESEAHNPGLVDQACGQSELDEDRDQRRRERRRLLSGKGSSPRAPVSNWSFMPRAGKDRRGGRSYVGPSGGAASQRRRSMISSRRPTVSAARYRRENTPRRQARTVTLTSIGALLAAGARCSERDLFGSGVDVFGPVSGGEGGPVGRGGLGDPEGLGEVHVRNLGGEGEHRGMARRVGSKAERDEL